MWLMLVASTSLVSVTFNQDNLHSFPHLSKYGQFWSQTWSFRMEVHRLSSPAGKLAVKSKQWSEKGSVGLRTGSSLPATRSHYTLSERTAANQHAAASHLYSMRYICILLYSGVCQFTHEVMNPSLRTMWVSTSARTEPWTHGLMIGRVGSGQNLSHHPPTVFLMASLFAWFEPSWFEPSGLLIWPFGCCFTAERKCLGIRVVPCSDSREMSQSNSAGTVWYIPAVWPVKLKKGLKWN